MNVMDAIYMSKAIGLAKKGEGKTSPNPLVGAVIVKDNKIIGTGYHQIYGGPHAERNALKDCREKGFNPAGADMYVTLEPCCHYGKTPPCTEAIIESGIKRVVIGSLDPNPKVAGKGVQILRDAGIEVVTDIMNEECTELNHVFFHYITEGKPLVILKYAMTMDGKIATYKGLSQWITSEKARERVQEDRNRCSAIMVGIGTVLADDPRLTCRIEGGTHPARIICDSDLRIPEDSYIVRTAGEIRTIIATLSDQGEKAETLKKLGCEIIVTEAAEDGEISLNDLVSKVGKAGIDSIILEGGSGLNWSALNEGIVDRVQTYIAPKIFGGEDAKTPVGGQGFERPEDCIRLERTGMELIGDDLLIESRVIRCSQE